MPFILTMHRVQLVGRLGLEPRVELSLAGLKVRYLQPIRSTTRCLFCCTTGIDSKILVVLSFVFHLVQILFNFVHKKTRLFGRVFLNLLLVYSLQNSTALRSINGYRFDCLNCIDCTVHFHFSKIVASVVPLHWASTTGLIIVIF